MDAISVIRCNQPSDQIGGDGRRFGRVEPAGGSAAPLLGLGGGTRWRERSGCRGAVCVGAVSQEMGRIVCGLRALTLGKRISS